MLFLTLGASGQLNVPRAHPRVAEAKDKLDWLSLVRQGYLVDVGRLSKKDVVLMADVEPNRVSTPI